MVNLLFSINGRISRGPFWLVYLILFPATLALILFIEASVNNNPVLTLIAFVLYFWIAICITVKRLHDIDATGWLSVAAKYAATGFVGSSAMSSKAKSARVG